MKPIFTRFRAYQLGCPGSSFSYFADGHFTLIEARLTDVNRPSLLVEMERCGVEYADTLHITSWDKDHCCPGELPELLNLMRPAKIETPGYAPYTDAAQESAAIIQRYRSWSNQAVSVRAITPEYIATLG
jgi:competence protein ComEC